jgi:hypothetical protein
MRSDPTDTGGLFIARRPGTAPVRYRELPQVGPPVRQRADGILSVVLLATMTVIALLCWGPIPVAGLWLGSRAQYLSGNVELGIVVSFGSTGAGLFGAVLLLQRFDRAWILVRRAARHDQRKGALARVFAVSAIVGVVIFSFWFLVILGPNDPNL